MNDEAQVEENLRIAADAGPDSLTAAKIDLVGRVSRKYREIMKVSCTGCGYCQPCPSGVDIPGNFDLFNAFHTFGKTQEAGFLYVVRLGVSSPASPLMLRYARAAWIASRNVLRA
jgi:predicted aldo/keto reductase-like oxidoreductase